MAGTVVVIDHPLVQHKLTLLRKAETSAAVFRALLREISMLLAYEVTRDMPLTYLPITTPLAPMQAPVLAGKKLVVVSIMRAGNGILDGMLELIPSARVGHIGLYRDPKTHVAVEYYFKVPEDIAERDALVVDPMLATGNSAVAALHRLKDTGAKTLKFVCLLAAPEGIAHVHEQHPDLPIYTAAIDERLDAHDY
ncbi:MAG TPA: uracil phosphoribosyltransferase, partial [Candidatus Saccharimonadia bacterium]|nr:uracil phosphoribosyltransferase [Candidatus Saccharimonadia bacterium]